LRAQQVDPIIVPKLDPFISIYLVWPKSYYTKRQFANFESVL
jgi:hypothetical protein